MRIPHITITQTFAKLGLDIKPADMQITKENSSINVQSEASELEVEYQDPDIRVDWQPVWDEIGLKGAANIGKDIRNKGNRKTLEIIGQIAHTGDRLGNIASGEKNAIGNMAKEAYFRKNRVQTTLVAIPSKGPTYQAQTYAPDVSVKLGTVTVNPNNIDPVIDYRIGDVHVYMLQKGHVDISI